MVPEAVPTQIPSGKKVIERTVVSDETVEVSESVSENKVLDSAQESTKMYQISMGQYADCGKLTDILVTITYTQIPSAGWTGGGGAIGYSAVEGWQQIDFEHAFVDGATNTKTYTIHIPDGITPTLDSGSIVQVGWWWGSTGTITVDSVEFKFAKNETKTIAIEVNEEAVGELTEPGDVVVNVADFAADVDTAAVESIAVQMASTGACAGNVYGVLADAGEIQLLAISEGETLLGTFEITEGGAKTFTYGGLTGLLAGSLRIEVTEVEAGATVVVDNVTLLNASGESLAVAVNEAPEEADSEESAEGDSEAAEDIENTEDTEDTDVTLPEEDIPLAEEETESGETDEVPVTGDRNLAVVFYAMILSAAGMVVGIRKRRKASEV